MCMGFGLGCSLIQLYMILTLQPGTSSLLMSHAPGPLRPVAGIVTMYLSYFDSAIVLFLLFQLCDYSFHFLFMALRSQCVRLGDPFHFLKVLDYLGELVPGDGNKDIALREQAPRPHSQAEAGDRHVHFPANERIYIEPGAARCCCPPCRPHFSGGVALGSDEYFCLTHVGEYYQ